MGTKPDWAKHGAIAGYGAWVWAAASIAAMVWLALRQPVTAATQAVDSITKSASGGNPVMSPAVPTWAFVVAPLIFGGFLLMAAVFNRKASNASRLGKDQSGDQQVVPQSGILGDFVNIRFEKARYGSDVISKDAMDGLNAALADVGNHTADGAVSIGMGDKLVGGEDVHRDVYKSLRFTLSAELHGGKPLTIRPRDRLLPSARTGLLSPMTTLPPLPPLPPALQKLNIEILEGLVAGRIENLISYNAYIFLRVRIALRDLPSMTIKSWKLELNLNGEKYSDGYRDGLEMAKEYSDITEGTQRLPVAKVFNKDLYQIASSEALPLNVGVEGWLMFRTLMLQTDYILGADFSLIAVDELGKEHSLLKRPNKWLRRALVTWSS